MIVHCQTCDTDFNLDESRLPPEGAWVRCSVCGEVFQVVPPAPAPPPPAAPPGPAPLDLQDYQDVDQQRAQQMADFGLEPEQQEPQPGRGPGFKALFWIIGVLLLLAIAGLGGVVVMERMGVGGPLMERFKSLPGLAPLMGKPLTTAQERGRGEEPVRMTLSQVRGFFRVNDTAGRLFIIQGRVDNHHPRARTAVLVQGRLHDAQGKVVRQDTSYAGATFTPEELRHLSLAAIQRRLSSPVGTDANRYVVGPGQSIPFLIVLANLPGQMMEFTAEVVASEPATSPGGGR